MKKHLFTTYNNGEQLTDSHFTKIVRGCDTPLKLKNALNKFIKEIQNLKNPLIKSGFTVKYELSE